jgi:hypothetical protein
MDSGSAHLYKFVRGALGGYMPLPELACNLGSQSGDDISTGFKSRKPGRKFLEPGN